MCLCIHASWDCNLKKRKEKDCNNEFIKTLEVQYANVNWETEVGLDFHFPNAGQSLEESLWGKQMSYKFLAFGTSFNISHCNLCDRTILFAILNFSVDRIHDVQVVLVLLFKWAAHTSHRNAWCNPVQG